jgi:hypothetical protein
MGLAMSDAQKILADARATLKRLEGCREQFAADNARRDRTFVPLPRVCPQATTREEPEPHGQDWSAWNDWCESHVERGLERAADIFGQEIGEIERALLERIESLEIQLGELRAEHEVERAARNQNVVDLPSNFLRRKSNAT